MKKISILFTFVFLLTMFGFVQAQSKTVEKVTTKVTLIDDFGGEHTFVGEGVQVGSGSGNFLRTAHLKVPQEILDYFIFEPYANIWIVGRFTFDTDGDGVEDTKVYDSKAFLNKSGNLSVSFHLNGAGKIIPRGH